MYVFMEPVRKSISTLSLLFLLIIITGLRERERERGEREGGREQGRERERDRERDLVVFCSCQLS